MILEFKILCENNDGHNLFYLRAEEAFRCCGFSDKNEIARLLRKRISKGLVFSLQSIANASGFARFICQLGPCGPMGGKKPRGEMIRKRVCGRQKNDRNNKKFSPSAF